MDVDAWGAKKLRFACRVYRRWVILCWGEKKSLARRMGGASGGMVGMNLSFRRLLWKDTGDWSSSWWLARKPKPMAQDVRVFYHCQLKKAFSHVRSFIEFLFGQLGTWDSLSKGPTAADSCPQFITKGVNGVFGGYSLSLLFTQDQRLSFKSKMCVMYIFILSPLISVSIIH